VLIDNADRRLPGISNLSLSRHLHSCKNVLIRACGESYLSAHAVSEPQRDSSEKIALPRAVYGGAWVSGNMGELGKLVRGDQTC
jgi:hypothetical protein